MMIVCSEIFTFSRVRKMVQHKLMAEPAVFSKYPPEISQQCEAPKIAKLVYNSNNYGLWYL